MRNAKRLAGMGAWLVVALASHAFATTVEALSLSDVVRRATRIVEARVVGVAPALDGQGRPATRVGLLVLSTLKGAPSGAVEFLLPGGTAGGRTFRIAGIPEFTAGEEVVLFLSDKSSAGLTLPIGLGQGTYRALADPKTGAPALRRDLAGLELRDPKTGAPVTGATTTVDRAAFVAEVRKLAAPR